jgi:hypothetical protein
MHHYKIFLICILFVACEKSSNDDVPLTTLVGRWKDTVDHEAFLNNQDGSKTKIIFPGPTYQFYSDGRFDVDTTAVGVDFYSTGTWEFYPDSNLIRFKRLVDTFSVLFPVSDFTWRNIQLLDNGKKLSTTSVYNQVGFGLELTKQRTFIRK